MPCLQITLSFMLPTISLFKSRMLVCFFLMLGASVKKIADGEQAGVEETEENEEYNTLKEWLSKPIEETYSDKILEKALKKISTSSFEMKLSDANAASKLIGNTYAASVFMGIASLMDRLGQEGESTTIGKRIVVFSYGSGSMASMYRLCIRKRKNDSDNRFSIHNMSKVINFKARLSSRVELDAKKLDEVMDCREKMHHAGCPYQPSYNTPSEWLFPGTYYLAGIDEKWRRKYNRLDT